MNGTKTIQRYEGENHVSYILNDEQELSSSAYKLLCSGKYERLLKCVKVSFNGRPKLIYLTERYRRLRRILPFLEEAEFLKILFDLIFAVQEVKESGLLKCVNIEFSEERIFVDGQTKEVRVIYLPVSGSCSQMEEYEFDKMVLSKLWEWSTQFTAFPGEGLKWFQKQMRNPEFSFTEFSRKYGEKTENVLEENAKSNGKVQKTKSKDEEREAVLILQNLSQGKSLKFMIRQDGYILGRSVYRADGLIPNNMRVSNTHCKIIRQDSKYFVMDLESRNGTYVNGVSIAGQSLCALKKGDRLRLADEEFLVDIMYEMRCE